MAKAFKCDICGKFYDHLKHKIGVRYRTGFYCVIKEFYQPERNIDLCPDCFKEITAFAEKLKQEKEQNNNG